MLAKLTLFTIKINPNSNFVATRYDYPTILNNCLVFLQQTTRRPTTTESRNLELTSKAMAREILFVQGEKVVWIR